jgi:antirestriction protein ArdC
MAAARLPIELLAERFGGGDWAGAPHRLDRQSGKRFGDQQYVAEELLAEIASASLCAELSITQDTRPDHAQSCARTFCCPPAQTQNPAPL